jgi:hypothetical protein
VGHRTDQQPTPALTPQIRPVLLSIISDSKSYVLTGLALFAHSSWNPWRSRGPVGLRSTPRPLSEYPVGQQSRNWGRGGPFPEPKRQSTRRSLIPRRSEHHQVQLEIFPRPNPFKALIDKIRWNRQDAQPRFVNATSYMSAAALVTGNTLMVSRA